MAAVPALDPDAIELLADAARRRPDAATAAREPRRATSSACFVDARPVAEEDRISYREVGVVASRDVVVTVRKTPPDGMPLGAASPGRRARARSVAPAQFAPSRPRRRRRVVPRRASTSPTTRSRSWRTTIDDWPSSRLRRRLAELRHELLHARRAVAATRGAVSAGSSTAGSSPAGSLVPPRSELRFSDTYETLVRAAEELDVARDLLARRAGVPPVHDRREPERRRQEADGDRVASAHADTDRRLLRPEFRRGVP